MVQKVQIKRTSTPNSPPAANSLTPGELAIEMDVPTRLWVGVPVALDPTAQKLLFDSSAVVGGPVLGITDGSAAAAGYVGEIIYVPSTPEAGQSPNVWFPVKSINLSPGQWEMNCIVNMHPSNGTIGGAQFDAAITSNAAPAAPADTKPGDPGYCALLIGILGSYTMCMRRIVNITVATTYYATGWHNASSAGVYVAGSIEARRIR